MKFPAPGAAAGQFTWDGRQFVGDSGGTCEVLCYDETPSNWSDELTRFHEQEGGRHHPIDEASRALALRSLERYCKGSEPVVLEVGCSSGYFLEDLRARMPQATILGADYLAEPLRRLARRLTGLPILQFDLRRCPLPAQSVDAVICLNVLEHIEDDAAAMQQMYRILRPGGIAHIEVPAGPALYDIYDELLLHHRRYRLRALKELARRSGFEIVRATHLGVFIYPLFAASKLWNRRRLKLSAVEKQKIVASQIRTTSTSRTLALLLKLESKLGCWLNYPIGIRCVLILRRA